MNPGLIVFLLEESSMQKFLEVYLPRLIPGQQCLFISHEGKQDLEKSIPRKLKAWRNASFVVVRDNDGADCGKLKERLRALCRDGGRSDSLVRIACQELEAWYLGAPSALAEVYKLPKLSALGRKAKYRDPDQLAKPSAEITNLAPEFRKIDGARRMGVAMPIEETENSSRSFQVFVKGVRRLAG